MRDRAARHEPPTVDRLRADISGGLTGEKIDFPDPSAVPLGTDDEAAGNTPTLQQRRMEDEQRYMTKTPQEFTQGPLVFYFGFAAALAIAIILFAYAAR